MEEKLSHEEIKDIKEARCRINKGEFYSEKEAKRMLYSIIKKP